MIFLKFHLISVPQSATQVERSHLVAEEADSLMAQLEEEQKLVAQVCAFLFSDTLGLRCCVLLYYDL